MDRHSKKNELFLHRIEIRDFRALGDGFTLELPNGPGVVLIVGQNGLGKSTITEAIEWALTGTVRRLGTISDLAEDADVYARRRADGGAARSYGVTLEFGDGAQLHGVRREAKRVSDDSAARFTSTASHSPVELQDLFTAPSWQQPVRDLGAYLHLTHLLSQSSGLRFAARSAGERWALLRAPAGTERLALFRRKLASKAVPLAITKSGEQARERLERLVEEACREFGVRYTAQPSFRAGVASHFRWLRQMGRA